ncbi:MAG: dipeptidase [Ruminococcus sp.]|nr:dipeptidase [Ruminococcus sp.]
MKYIDLHCDTLYKSVTQNIPIDSSDMEVKPVLEGDTRLQCYAIWLPDDFGGDRAEELFFEASQRIVSECNFSKINLIRSFRNLEKTLQYGNNAVFTVENGLALNGKIENVRKFSELGVRIMTLTWNAHNHIGDGADVKNAMGLTEFGRLAVNEMEKYKIIVDISHASDKLFYDVAEIANKPFIATHSNSRKIAEHRRNLTDEQFKVIIDRGGIVGLNFHNAFLSNNPDKASAVDLLKHTEHFLSLGGENHLCVGSDFDGCDLPDDIKNSDSIATIYEMFLKNNYKEELLEKIFFKNALNFFENFDNLQ